MTQTQVNTDPLQISDEVREHITLNASTETYRNLPGEFCKRGERWGHFIQFDKLREIHLADAIKNVALINERIKTRANRKEILNGDIIRFADGREERVTHIWGTDNDSMIQAGGGSGSYYMSNTGSGSYSGSLNEGTKYGKLQLSDETKPCMFWMFSKDWAGGGRGIYFYCPVKVWQERY